MLMTPDATTLCKVEVPTAAPVPTANHVFGVSNVEDVDNLTESATVTYKPRNFIPLPPFLMEPIHDAITASNGDAKVALVACIKEIKKFDTDHNEDQSYNDKAKVACKPIALWLYLVGKDSPSIAAVNTTGCINKEMIEALTNAHTLHLQAKVPVSETPAAISTQVESSLKRPFEVLAATSSSTTDFMEKLTLLHSQNQEKSSKTFKKIPAKYQQMILVAASVGEVTEVDYDADAAEFFKCSTTLHAQVMLNSLFEAEGVDCSVSAAVATTLLYGSFLWKNPLSPSGLAASVLSSEGFMRSDTLHEGMVLDYATKFDMSAASLSKLTKTQVLFPVDLEELTHRIRGLQLLAAFFFKRNGYMSQGLKQVVNYCLDNRTTLRTRIHLDKTFIAKFVCAIDERIYSWLRQCSIKQMVTETDISLMDFNYMLQDINFNRFYYTLPPNVASVVTKTVGREHETKRDPPQGKPQHVRNDCVVQEWKIRPSETWANIFRNKTINGPMLSMKCHPCLKFHVRGVCYADCRNKDSHCTLVGEDKARVTQFIKPLRGE